MTELDRRAAGRFRAVVRRGGAGRLRVRAPPVVLQQEMDGVTLSVVVEDLVLALRLPGSSTTAESVVVPFTALAAWQGVGNGVVRLDLLDSGSVRCSWEDRGSPREL